MINCARGAAMKVRVLDGTQRRRLARRRRLRGARPSRAPPSIQAVGSDVLRAFLFVARRVAGALPLAGAAFFLVAVRWTRTAVTTGVGAANAAAEGAVAVGPAPDRRLPNPLA